MWQIIGTVRNKEGVSGELQMCKCEDTDSVHYKIVIPKMEYLVKNIQDGIAIQSDDTIWEIL